MATDNFFLSGPTEADVQSLQREQDIRELQAIGTAGPSAFLGLTTGRLFGRAINQALGATEDPQIQQARALESAKNQILQTGLIPGDPGFDKAAVGILNRHGLYKQAVMARQLHLEVSKAGIDLRGATASAEKTELANKETRAASTPEGQAKAEFQLFEKDEDSRRAMRLARQRTKRSDFDSQAAYQRALIERATKIDTAIQDRSRFAFSAQEGRFIETKQTPIGQAADQALGQPAQPPRQAQQQPQAAAQPAQAPPAAAEPQAQAPSQPDIEGPPPLVGKRSITYRPVPGAQADTSRTGVQKFQGEKANLQGYVAALNRLVKEVQKSGTKFGGDVTLPFGVGAVRIPRAATKRLEGLHKSVITLLNRDVANLGALAGADIAILEAQVPSPVSPDGMLPGNVDAVLKAYEDHYRQVANIAQQTANKFGKPLQVPRFVEFSLIDQGPQQARDQAAREALGGRRFFDLPIEERRRIVNQ